MTTMWDRLKASWNGVIIRDKNRQEDTSNIPVSMLGDAYMEKMVTVVKKVPYSAPTGSNGDYNLRFDLKNMVEDGHIPVLNTVANAASRKANAHDIVTVVLAEISHMSKFSQDVQIRFKMKSGWTGHIKVWLYPEFYYGEPSGHQTEFSEIYLVENDPSFLSWESVYYRDTSEENYHPSYEIYLNTRDMWDRYCCHYTGICRVSWVELLNQHITEAPTRPKVTKPERETLRERFNRVRSSTGYK